MRWRWERQGHPQVVAAAAASGSVVLVSAIPFHNNTRPQPTPSSESTRTWAPTWASGPTTMTAHTPAYVIFPQRITKKPTPISRAHPYREESDSCLYLGPHLAFNPLPRDARHVTLKHNMISDMDGPRDRRCFCFVCRFGVGGEPETWISDPAPAKVWGTRGGNWCQFEVVVGRKISSH